MKQRPGHRKRIRHYHAPGHIHERTFSCYHRWPSFRYWQEGPGYDRNFTKPSTVLPAIDYLHHNPVRRGLVKRAVDWKWSSARYYWVDPPCQYPPLPTIHSLPAQWLGTTE
jgi:hypothetical protein